MLDDFTCPLPSTKPVEKWLSEEDAAHCHSCLLSTLASYYVGALEGANQQELANTLKRVFEGGDVLTIGRTLDNIKRDVGDKLRQDLKKLDCMAQTQEEA